MAPWSNLVIKDMSPPPCSCDEKREKEKEQHYNNISMWSLIARVSVVLNRNIVDSG